MIANVKGSFRTFDASILKTNKDFTTAAIDLWIDASTINTGDPNRGEHLTSKDFLDVRNHKQITFRSNIIGEADADGNRKLWGD